MRLTTRLLTAAALTGALATAAVPAATAATAIPTSGYSTIVHESGFGEVTVRCPYGYRATGGGIAVDHKDEIDTLYDRPTQDGRGWEGLALGEVEPPEKDGDKGGESSSGKESSGKESTGKESTGKKDEHRKKGEMDQPDEKLHGLPLTVYAVCSMV